MEKLMTTNILVPLDGSRLAEQALPTAATLAQELEAGLVLLHAISFPPDIKDILAHANLETDVSVEQLEAKAEDYLRQAAEQLTKKGLRVQRTVRHAEAAEAIIDYAHGADVGQIVMATHGYSGISRWAYGSVTERVLHLSRVPLLLVRAPSQDNAAPEPPAFRRILTPLDGSDRAEQVLEPAALVARAFGAEMILFRVSSVQISGSLTGRWYLPIQDVLKTVRQESQTYLERVAAGLREQGLEVSTAMRVGRVANSIIDHARIKQVDLIAMCTHGRTGLARWTLGSVADRVLRASNVPIFLVRAR
jgi:nucleotide-binding universal stress UspA family protein